MFWAVIYSWRTPGLLNVWCVFWFNIVELLRSDKNCYFVETLMDNLFHHRWTITICRLLIAIYLSGASVLKNAALTPNSCFFSLWGVFGMYSQHWKECMGSSIGNAFSSWFLYLYSKSFSFLLVLAPKWRNSFDVNDWVDITYSGWWKFLTNQARKRLSLPLRYWYLQ